MGKEELTDKLKGRIDSSGFYIEAVFTSKTSDDLISTEIPDGLFKPKWTGSKWIEGDIKCREAHDRIQYRYDRQYKPIGEQLGQLFDAIANGGTIDKNCQWFKDIEAEKLRVPKPSSTKE